MSDQRFARLEAHLERLIEGAFAQLFGKTLRPQDIAVQLSRAMQQAIAESQPGAANPFAPDEYTIVLNPQVRAHLLAHQPTLASILSQHLVELANSAGCRLNRPPNIQLIADEQLGGGELRIAATYANFNASTTVSMERVPTPTTEHQPRNPQLIINGQGSIPLTEPMVTIGRSRDNRILLDDPRVSRHHAQLRLRFGVYTIFDANSQGGTFVNDVRVREHRLQSGDVIRVGDTRLVYLEEDPPAEGRTGVTSALRL